VSSERALDTRARAEFIFGVWNDEGMEAMAERFWDDEVVWEEARQFPDAGVRRGRAACVRRMRERFAEVGEVKIEVIGAEQIGDLILTETIVRGQGTASGVPTEMREFYLAEVRDGRTLRFWEFLDRDEAFAAARAEAGGD
jgi:ketosteroid isomerase-like protein